MIFDLSILSSIIWLPIIAGFALLSWIFRFTAMDEI